LPLQDKVAALETMDKGKNKLSEAQKAQLKTVLQAIQPQMDAALGDSWAKQDQLMGQISQLVTKVIADPAAAQNDQQLQQQMKANGKQMEELEKTMAPQMAAFDQQAQTAMTPYLTADQVAALKAMPAGGNQNFLMTGPHGEGEPPADGEPGPDFRMKFKFNSGGGN
jgi:hypothetical protein